MLISNQDWKRNSAVVAKEAEESFDALNTLTKDEIKWSIGAGLIGATADILFLGIPKKTSHGLEEGTWGNFVRKQVEKQFPEADMKKLANSNFCKVPYDAQDNRHTVIPVQGLSSYLHRQVSIGHDPVLGMFFGVRDILKGKMTTIDGGGRIVCQVIPGYEKRRGKNLFEAIAKQIVHMKSDATTAMGLPAPFMVLFNLFQFGSIGDADKTIAEIVQEMYVRGYDFIHFCSLSMPVMITEVMIRLTYAVERIKEGNSVSESIPILKPGEHSKLVTMLLIGHTVAVAVNAGKVYFTRDPMVINCNQWLAFGRYACKELKWLLNDKKKAKDIYIENYMIRQLAKPYEEVCRNFACAEKIVI